MIRLLKYLFPYKKFVLLGILSLILTDLAQLLVPQIIRKTIDNFIYNPEFIKNLKIYVLLTILLAIVILIFRFFWRYFLIGGARRAERDLRDRLYGHLLGLDSYFYRAHPTGDLMAHLTNDIDAVRYAWGFGIVGIMDTLTYGIFSLVAMVLISPKLTLIALLPLPIISVVMFFGGKIIHRKFTEVQETFADLTEAVRETISGIRVIKTFNAYMGRFKILERWSEKYVDKSLSMIKISGFLPAFFTFVGGLSTAIVLYFGGYRVILGEISLGDFVAFTTYLGILIWPLIAIGWVVNIFQQGKASLDRIEKLLEAKPQIIPGKIKEIQKGYIQIKNLTFSYNGSGNVLENINLRINPQEFVGFVGLVASGKSTLVKLLLRIVDPPQNTIFIDGVDIRDYELETLREFISYVPQDPSVFSFSLRDNLTLGLKNERGANISDDELLHLLDLVELKEDVLNMPKGLYTEIGERGITLSGGQKQRVALVRALLKPSGLLILDDCFSSVDAETETKIIQNLMSNFKNKTTILITHRLTSMAFVDKIYVFERGKIIEEGKHEELLERNGLYAMLYKLQKMSEYTLNRPS